MKLQAILPSELSVIGNMQDSIARELKRRGYCERDVLAARLILEEALRNAMKHGNRMDPRKIVWLGCVVSDRRVRISVRDQGAGFQLARVPDPTAPHNRENLSGRGIHLMRSFARSLKYSRSGNRLVVVIGRSGPPKL